jgi:hypothetical protein
VLGGNVMESLWRLIIRAIDVALAFGAFLMGVILVLAIVVGINGGQFEERWIMFQWFAVLSLSMFAFSNMVLFTWRLRRVSSSVHDAVAQGRNASVSMLLSRSAFRRFHGRVVQIAMGRLGPFDAGLRLHASITRYLNVICLIGWISLPLAASALFVYMKIAGTT